MNALPWRRTGSGLSIEPRLEPEPARVVMPTRSLLQGGPYVPAASTDIRKRFASIKAAQQAQPKN